MASAMRGRFPYWALAAAMVVSSCHRPPDAEEPGNAVENQTSLPRLPVAEPPLDRAAILAAVAQAASAAGLGENDAEQQRLLDGKRFELRIRFGCPLVGAPDKGERFSVTFNEEDRTLRIRAAPDVTLDDPQIAQVASDAVEAVEGIWLRRPWVLAARCPVVARTATQPADPGDATADKTANSRNHPEPADRTALEANAAIPPAGAGSGPRVGIAQFFTEADPRTIRRNQRAYETTKVLAEGELPSPEGYNLILSGRLRAIPGGRVITCLAQSFATPPDCIVSAEFDRVWIERPDSKAIIAEWSR